MVQSINSVSLFFEVSQTKTASKMSDSKFESFLETENADPAVKNQDNLSDTAENKQVKESHNSAEKETAFSKADEKTSVEQTAQKQEECVEITENVDFVTERIPDNVNVEQTELFDSVFDIEDYIQTGFIPQKDEVELPDEILAEILSVLNEITSVFQNMFRCTEEQLLEAAQSVQFEITDFFEADKVRELFLQLQNAEAPELLTNETLCNEFLELQTQIDAVLQDSTLSELLPEAEMFNESFDISEYKEQIINFVIENSNEVGNVITQQSVMKEMPVQPTDVKQTDGKQEKKQVSENESVPDSDLVVVSEEEVSVKTDSSAMQNNMSEADDEILSDAEPIETNDTLFETESSAERVNVFLNKLVSVAKNQLSETAPVNNQTMELYDIAMQVIEQVRLQVSPDTSKMEIQLNPEHLGKVEIEITSQNGELSARLNVQNDQVKEAVESQMQMLRETLEVQGLKVENIEVTVAEFGFRFQDESGNNQPQQQQQRRNGFVNFDETDSDDGSLHDVAEVMKELNGNSVDYVA